VETQLLSTDTEEGFNEALELAVAQLRQGEVVAVPTETVYGLAANALEASSVEKIFTGKDRPAQNPIIVHVSSESMARDCVAQWPESAGKLANAFWPGPLTLVLPKADTIPGNVVAGGATVGVRWPSHPFIQQLITACSFPLAAPSANLSNHISPTSAEHVKSQMEGRIPLIIDGGPAQVGIESTVVDLSGDSVRVLRPGMISMEAIEAVLSDGAITVGKDECVLKSPGQLERHYAPNARLLVLNWKDEEDLENQISYSRTPHDRVHVIAHTHVVGGTRFGRVSMLPREAQAYAQVLYGELHRCDQEGAELICVEAPPDDPEWVAINDRLSRAGG
jgi:L-threonylcarbamoyladenylate synthase